MTTDGEAEDIKPGVSPVSRLGHRLVYGARYEVRVGLPTDYRVKSRDPRLTPDLPTPRGTGDVTGNVYIPRVPVVSTVTSSRLCRVLDLHSLRP